MPSVDALILSQLQSIRLKKYKMEKTEIKVGTDYMSFVYKLHQVMVDQKLTLVYDGEVNQEITKVFTTMTERNLEGSEDDHTTKQRVYHVMVECLQNICKHADDVETGEPYSPGMGVFLVGYDDDSYSITTGNVISNDKVEGIQNILDNINSLDKDEIKQLYKKTMKENRLNDKAGAGLGLIDIVKKTKNKIEYFFEPINEMTTFFIVRTKITRRK